MEDDAAGAAAAFRAVHPAQFYDKFLDAGIRPDGRELSACRATSVVPGSVSRADGSCLVKLGRTTVLATVRGEIGLPAKAKGGGAEGDAEGEGGGGAAAMKAGAEPEPGAGEEGRLVVAVEFTPLASPAMRPGRSNGAAAAAASLLTRVLEGCGAVDCGALAVAPGVVWVLYVDVAVLDHDGNFADAAMIAAVGALRDTTLPELAVEDGKAWLSGAARRRLGVRRSPVPLTCALLRGRLVADPTLEEEHLCGTASGGGADIVTAAGDPGAAVNCITAVLDESGALCSVHKPGGAPLDDAQMREVVQRAKERARQVHALFTAEPAGEAQPM